MMDRPLPNLHGSLAVPGDRVTFNYTDPSFGGEGILVARDTMGNVTVRPKALPEDPSLATYGATGWALCLVVIDE